MFTVFLKLLLVGEHSIGSQRRKGGYGIRPYGQNVKIRTHFVGDDILGVPFARRNLTKSLLQWEKVPRNEADEVSLI